MALSVARGQVSLAARGPSKAWVFLPPALLILLVAFAPPLVSAAILGTGLILTLLLTYPMLALYFLAFSIPYESLREVQLGGLNATATEYVALLGGLSFLLRSAAKRGAGVHWSWWSWPMILYIAAAALSVTGASEIKYSIKELLKLTEMLLTYLLVLSSIDTPKRLRRLLLVIALAASSEALLGIVQTLAHYGPVSFNRGGILRASGTFDQPNPYAGYLNFTLPLLFAGVVKGVSVAGRYTRWMFLALGAGVLLSVSRGALLGTIGAIMLIALLANRWARSLVALAVVAFVALLGGGIFGVLPTSLTTPVLEDFGLSGVDIVHPTALTWAVAERLAHIVAGLRMFAAHPIFGVGIGNYPAVYEKYRVINTMASKTDPSYDLWFNPLGHAHNYFVNIAAEAGIVGLLAFLVLIVAAFITITVLYRRSATPFAKCVTLGCLGSLVTVVVQSLFDNIFVHAMEVQLALVMGVATVAAWQSTIPHRGTEQESREAHG